MVVLLLFGTTTSYSSHMMVLQERQEQKRREAPGKIPRMRQGKTCRRQADESQRSARHEMIVPLQGCRLAKKVLHGNLQHTTHPWLKQRELELGESLQDRVHLRIGADGDAGMASEAFAFEGAHQDAFFAQFFQKLLGRELGVR